MNTEIHNAFINALLADASYVEGLLPGMTGSELSGNLRIQDRLTVSLAKYLGDSFRVVTQFTAPGSSGFSVTVFEEKATGQKYVSFRGTEPSDWARDFGTDGDAYFSSGLARSQIIEMVNWYLRATAPTSDMFVTQFYLNRPFDPLTGELGPATYQVQGEGTLLGAGMLIADGHSLGGHLTTVFTRLFAADVSNSYTYNGLGVGRLFPETFMRELESELGLGTTYWPDAAKQRNFYAEHGISVATTSSWLSQKGLCIPLFNEEGTGIPNHLMYKLTDTLALCDVMGMIDNGISLEDATRLLDAASSRPNASLEKLLDSLRRLCGASDQTPTLIGDAENSAPSRLDLHARLSTLRGLVQEDPLLRGTFVSLVAKSAADLNTIASNPEAHATRYALCELNPFVVLGFDYSRFNQNGELDLYDPATGRGQLTADYLTDRAAMLAWQNLLNARDIVTSPARPYTGSEVTEATLFLDRAGGTQIVLGGQLSTRRKILFGAEGKDLLDGGALNDRLYGGGGDDVLHGNGGNDYLEGDAGDDILIGGAGYDIYNVGAGGGSDTIEDVAEGPQGRQLGEVRFGTTAVTGTFTALDPELKGFRLEAADGTYLATYTGSVQADLPGTLWLWREGHPEAVAMIHNFRSGDLGIVLGAAAPQRTYADIFGTQEADNSKLDITMTHQDTLGTTAEAQKVFGLGGADYIVLAHAYTAGYGGAGNDRIIDGTGMQQLYGEEGDDTLVAGAGNDELFGGAGNDVLQGGADNDLLDGGEGDDFLDGGIGADAIFGGAGRDFILGGGNLTLELKVDTDYFRFATGAYPGLSFVGDQVSLPHLVGVDPWFPGQWLDTGYAFVEGDLGDAIDAGDGDDWVFSGDGADSVLGGSGADYLVGGAGNDYIDGGEDGDTIFGDGTQGDMTQAPGSFWFYTHPQYHGSDVLRGGGGNDYIRGDGGNDLLYGDDGDDELLGDANQLEAQYHGDDYLEGGNGNDRLFGQGGNDQLYGGDGDDILMGDDSTVPTANHGNDYLDGGAGADLLVGAGGSDVLFGGDGDDILAGDADDVAAEYQGNDYLDGGAGNDYLRGYGGDDVLIGGDGNDELYGEAGNDYLYGGDGNDQLSGGEGNDYLAGGPGTDILDGGLGDDTYVIDAQDLLAAPGSMVTGIQDAGGNNTLILAGMDLAGVTVSQGLGANGNDLVLTLDDGSRITLGGGAAGTIANYGTGDGTLLAPVEFLEAANTGALDLHIDGDHARVAGGRGDDRLDVNGTGNTIAGGKGDDLIVVGGADNVVEYRPGDGADTLRSLAATGTVIRFGAGIAPADIHLRLEGGDLVVGIGEGADNAIRLPGFDRDRPYGNPPISGIRFADGSAMTYGELLALGLEIYGTAGDDALQGTALNDRLMGLAGDDDLYGAAGEDTLFGGEGDDVLNGGMGNDVLLGGEGSDTYVVNPGTGMDTLVDDGGGSIELGMGIALDGVDAQRDGLNLVLHMPGAADGIVIQGYFETPQTWEIHDTSGNSATADELLSGAWASGRDWLQGLKQQYEQSGKQALANQYLGWGYSYVNANELRRYVVTNASASFVSGQQTQVNTYEWFDGRTASETRIISLDDWRPSQYAAIEDRVVRIGTQTVMASGSSFFTDDWSTVSSGYWEQRWVGLNWATTSLSALQTEHWAATNWIMSGGSPVGTVSSDNTSRHQSGSASGSITGVLPGAPAVIPGSSQLFPSVGRAYCSGSDATYSFVIVKGDDGDNEITGGSLVEAGAGNDVVTSRGFIDGGDGDDRLYNGAVMFGGRGDDVLMSGDLAGAEAEEVNRYCFGGAEQGSDLVIDEGWIGYAEGDYDYYYAALDPYFLELGTNHWAARYFHGGEWLVDDGDEWRIFYQTEAEAQAAAAYSGGTVRFVEALPEALQIHANDFAALAPLVQAGYIAEDVVEFGPGISPEALSISWGSVIVEGTNAFHHTLDISYGAGSVARITLPNADDLLGCGIERFRFADGRTLTMGEMIALAPPRPEHNPIAGTDWGDYLIGTSVPDLMLGIGGDDQLYGLAGDDVLDGGAGDDILVGGVGSDTYRFGRGGGFDSVVQTEGVPGDADKVRFADDILPTDVLASRENDALLLTISDTGDTITLQDWFIQADNRVSRVEFSDGTIWTPQLLEQAPAIIVGSDNSDYLTGTGGDDVFRGMAGNDYLQGWTGNDVYWFARGDGADTISQDGAAAGDVDTLRFGGDIAPSEIVAALDWDGLRLSVGDAGDSVLLSNWFFQTDERIDRIEFGDGTVWDNAVLEALAARTTGTDADEVLWGTSGNDLMSGFGGVDQLYGGAGSDVLNGGAGEDNLEGGAGDDVYLFNRGDGTDWIYDQGLDTDVDTLRFGTGISPQDIVVASDEWNLYLTVRGTQDVAALDSWFFDPSGRIERVEFADGTVWEAASLEDRLDVYHIAGTAGNDRLTGTAGRDVIQGFEGDDVLNGRAGADTMLGGLGDDTYYVDDAGDVVVELADEGTDRVISTVSYVLGDNVENLTLTGTDAVNCTGNALNNVIVGNAASNTLDGLAGDDRLTGGASDDVLIGGEGNDVLNGAAGADTMLGGAGDDVYRVDDAGDVVVELADEGTDRVISTVSYVLGDNVENLTLSGTEAINGAGNALDNVLAGNAAINLLSGGDGNDRLNGGAGMDFLEGGAGYDVLADTSGAGYFNGGAGNDSLRGDGEADFFIGGAGNDSINTGTGADIIAFNLGDGQDTVAASIGADNVLSLGGGIAYSDLRFRKSGNNLILDIGATDRITLSNWYAAPENRSVLTLQVIAEAMADFDAGGSDTLRDNRVETFDFAGLANAFDAARAANPGLSSWAVTSALMQFHLSGSDGEALGGDLAYQYGRYGTLAGIGLTAAQEVLGDARFGVQAQALRPLAGLQDGAARLG